MPDVFANITSVPGKVLEIVAKVLETRAAIPSQQEMLRDYLSQNTFAKDAEVLEVGCGMRAFCCVVVDWPNVVKVAGVEPSPVLLVKARELSDGIARIEFEEANGKALRFYNAYI